MTDKERIEEIEREFNKYKNLYKILHEAENTKVVEALEKVKDYIDTHLEDNYGFNGRHFYVVEAHGLKNKLNEVIKEYGGEE